VERIKKELFHIADKIFIINSNPGHSNEYTKCIELQVATKTGGYKMPADKIEICAVCAWRADCKKKFSISGRDIKCPDFVRDLSLPKNDEKEKNKT
ncbi:MAG: hypothetical protein AAB089_05775, partial [Nitrospirota bacterium]